MTPLLQGNTTIFFSTSGCLFKGLYILDQDTKDSGDKYPHGIEASLIKEIYCFVGVPFCKKSLEGKQEK